MSVNKFMNIKMKMEKQQYMAILYYYTLIYSLISLI